MSRFYGQLSWGAFIGDERLSQQRSNRGERKEAWRSAQTHQRARLGRRGAVYGLSSFRRSNSGSLAKLAAMRRASSGGVAALLVTHQPQELGFVNVAVFDEAGD